MREGIMLARDSKDDNVQVVAHYNEGSERYKGRHWPCFQEALDDLYKGGWSISTSVYEPIHKSMVTFMERGRR